MPTIPPRPTYRQLWRGWAALSVVGFAVIEFFAIKDPDPGDTLSEQSRAIFRRHPVLWFASKALHAWLDPHIFAPTAPWTRSKV